MRDMDERYRRVRETSRCCMITVTVDDGWLACSEEEGEHYFQLPHFGNRRYFRSLALALYSFIRLLDHHL